MIESERLPDPSGEDIREKQRFLDVDQFDQYLSLSGCMASEALVKWIILALRCQVWNQVVYCGVIRVHFRE